MFYAWQVNKLTALSVWLVLINETHALSIFMNKYKCVGLYFLASLTYAR